MSPMSPRLLRPRATGFSPNQIAGLSAWWDASDASTVTVNSGSVSEWRDKSGANRHLTQATAANRPGYTSAAQNGRGGVAFTGSSSHSLGYGAGVFTFSGGGTVLVVSKGVTRPSNNNYGPFVFEGTASTNQMLALVVGVYGTAGFRPSTDIFQPSGIRPTSTFDGSLPLISSWRWSSWQNHKTNGETSIGVNGNSVTVEAYGATNPSDFTSGSPVYRVGVAGNSVSSDAFLTATVCEIIAYSRSISASELQRVEGYLAWKWGLQATLPYDHPYAASFPGYGTQATPTDADTLAYLSAVKTADGGTGVEVGVATAVDSFVKGCKADGTWTAIKASCILMGARTLSGALTPLVGTAPTNNNFVTADYNRKTGLVGNGSTKYLDSNRLSTASGRNDFHQSAYVSTVGGGAIGGAGGADNGATHISLSTVAPNPWFFRNRTAGFYAGNESAASGFVGSVRSGSASYTSRINSDETTVLTASDGDYAHTLRVFARFNNTDPTSAALSSYASHRMAFYSYGDSLNLSLLHSRVSALYTAIGAAI